MDTKGTQHNYEIIGFVAFQGKYEGSSGHYVEYVSVGTNWLLYDDQSSGSSPSVVDLESEVDPQLLIYVKKC